MGCVLALLLLSGGGVAARAGEVEIHGRTGYFTWEERIEGRTFIKERGILSAAGIRYTGRLAGVLDGSGMFEVWGGNVDYHGYRVEGWTSYRTDTVYFGVREELSAVAKLPLAKEAAVGPLAGVGHKYWSRSRSSERWNVLYAKLGGRAEYGAAAGRLFAAAGVTLPFYARTRVDWSDYGYRVFSARPRGAPAGFAEAGIGLRNRVTIGVYYEEMNFAMSEKVFLERVDAPPGVVQIDSFAFQPDSRSWTAGLRIGYGF
jgi:hypothetical protein